MLNDLVPFAKVTNVIKTGSVWNGVRITPFKLYSYCKFVICTCQLSYSLILDEEKQAIMAYRSGEALQIPFFYPFICMKNIS